MKKRHFRDKVKRNHSKNGQVVRREPEFPTLPAAIEKALIGGDLSELSTEERVRLYMQTCKTLRLNPLTKPFGYILFKDWESSEDDKGKLVLYATRNCTDQLRSVYGASDVPGSLKRSEDNDYLYAEIQVIGRNGRVSTDLGVVPLIQFSRRKREFYKMSGRELANAKMKVVTKARRRATLALYGLGGIVDESELDTMNVIGGVTKEGRIWRYANREPEPDRLLEESMDYPKNSPKAAVAAAQLAKVEALDREFASVRSSSSVPAGHDGAASKPVQSQPADGKKLGNSPSAQAGAGEGAKPSPPAAPSLSKAEVSSTAKKPAPGQLNRFNDRPTETLKPPQALIPHRITKVRWTKDGKHLAVELDTGNRLYAFDDFKTNEDGERFFNVLLASEGKMAIFKTQKAKEKDYFSITGVLQIGEREWDESGVPILRREPATREPGEEPF